MFPAVSFDVSHFDGTIKVVIEGALLISTSSRFRNRKRFEQALKGGRGDGGVSGLDVTAFGVDFVPLKVATWLCGLYELGPRLKEVNVGMLT